VAVPLAENPREIAYNVERMAIYQKRHRAEPDGVDCERCITRV
jgi:hypothetical protein